MTKDEIIRKKKLKMLVNRLKTRIPGSKISMKSSDGVLYFVPTKGKLKKQYINKKSRNIFNIFANRRNEVMW
jgi:hypothetical protein